MSHTAAVDAAPLEQKDPWPALLALCLGFFMIMVDSTIVSVATPAIIESFGSDVNDVVWVTSAYLLAYAVPLLITGRLGDRYGPKNLYIAGLVVFTLASLWCGLTTTIGMLIVARVVQGLGAAMITPQTMAIITRIFPAQRRGRAMSLWGATAGVAGLVGPILGGVLVDWLGWQWIFLVNIPVGVVGIVLAVRLVPRLETNPHRFDWLGVVLSGLGVFLVAFGLQEGHQYDWSTITGFVTVWDMIAAGAVLFVLFLIWQARNRREPLVPLALFRDRNFSLANVAISTMGFCFAAFVFPFMLYAQLVRGLSPTRAALLLAPMAVMLIVLAPIVGRLTDRLHPRLLTTIGFATLIASLVVLSRVMTPGSPTWTILVTMVAFGVGNALIWAPVSATATRNLPPRMAGAGAGIYNTTRQVGAVLGSAAIAVLMDTRLAANGLGGFSPDKAATVSQLPQRVLAPFAHAMSQATLLPAAVLVAGLVASVLLTRPAQQRAAVPPVAPVGRHVDPEVAVDAPAAV